MEGPAPDMATPNQRVGPNSHYGRRATDQWLEGAKEIAGNLSPANRGWILAVTIITVTVMCVGGWAWTVTQKAQTEMWLQVEKNRAAEIEGMREILIQLLGDRLSEWPQSFFSPSSSG